MPKYEDFMHTYIFGAEDGDKLDITSGGDLASPKKEREGSFEIFRTCLMGCYAALS